ncbi:hydrogenase maturation protease [Dictyobacter aurantiacus]|uniref:Peptidase M52 n=1 Tax=Dictyobacter aurantiacus TaxID=1936993 RepID=A0A401ZSI0_9CHLR|nr:hydrogenase maturation protease [Dictyobacter aurantiacus]GCE09868.1 peptidase M52 [Dictyobacter aurantiacus]
MSGRMLVIGIGNGYRSDDGAGLLVLQMLKEKQLPDGVTCLESDGDGAWLLDAWAHAERVILIDAVASGACPGTVHRLDPHGTNMALAAPIFCSSHAFGVGEAIQLARALNRLPSDLLIYGIEGERFRAGTALSPLVERAVHEVVELVWRDIQTHMIK